MQSPRKGSLAVVLVASLGLPGTGIGQIEVAGELFVDVDAADPSAGSAAWTNNGTLADLQVVGDPVVETIDGVPAVTFDGVDDAYQSAENAPAGLVGPDPTRSIEVWVYNLAVNAGHESMVAWGRRGGDAGTNMTFGYGDSGAFGAVGHWGGPDLGWATVPAVGQWHHLVYTFDGETTRVYDNGALDNSEALGFGAVNTHAGTKITLASQIDTDGLALAEEEKGSLSLARVRVHDEVLTADQILNNFNEEAADFLPTAGPSFVDAPEADSIFLPSTTYSVTLRVEGLPIPDLAVLEPAGAVLAGGPFAYTLTYDLPDPPPDSFDVALQATNSEGQVEASWTVTVEDDICADFFFECAGELFVYLDADHGTAGEPTWENMGTGDNFVEVSGDPMLAEVGCPARTAVLFDGVLDVYQSIDDAPSGLVGVDPTRSVEVWAFNEAVGNEETMVAWGRRGGNPDGSNISFNYGTSGDFGAVGHWGGADIGWGVVPSAGEWHHLVYTYDGETTRVYVDGVETNSEFLGAGTINTHAGTKINLASQFNDDGMTLTDGLRGSLALAKIRIHDGVLTPEQILTNYDEEVAEFCPPPPPIPPAIVEAPDSATFTRGDTSYVGVLTASGDPIPTLELIDPLGGFLDQATFASVPRDEARVAAVVTIDLPEPQPDSFDITVSASSAEGIDEVTWTVTAVDPPAENDPVQIAGELFVELFADDPTAGTLFWENGGTLVDFGVFGEPVFGLVDGVPAVTFDGADDAYQCLEPAPAGLVGIVPTRTIEVWAHNPEIADEETILSWGHRGGPPGTNMSFNYGVNDAFGAVGSWGAPDLGWGTVPAAGEWHHLVYTFDGATTRVYADGVEANFELLGPGAINTHAGTPITLASQLDNATGALTDALKGSLSIGLVRVHDGVLGPQQVLHNYNVDRATFFPEAPPIFESVPAEDFAFRGGICGGTYSRTIVVAGNPTPTVTVEAPPSATITPDAVDPTQHQITIDLAGEPDVFDVTVRATNDSGTEDASWTVTQVDAPSGNGPIEVACDDPSCELFVDLDARDPSAGTEFWDNDGSMDGFESVGNPQATCIDGVRGVSFNQGDSDDAYQSLDPAPAGLVGPDPTRSIEVWAHNPEIANEEAMVAWGRRGGPDAGSNLSFNYGASPDFGAVGHWGDPDLGWGIVPAAGEWHHLVYTFDGDTTRVYADGVETSSEVLGPGIINTHVENRIVLAVQSTDAAGTLDFGGGREGTLTLARVRVHDGVLTPEQVLANYESERCSFDPSVLCVSEEPLFRRGDTDGNGRLEITDPINSLSFQFLGTFTPPCKDAADFDDNGKIEITDPIASLSHQFLGEDPPPAPGKVDCGIDPTADDGNGNGTPGEPDDDLGCDNYPAAGAPPEAACR